jgi:hypothetical protein
MHLTRKSALSAKYARLSFFQRLRVRFNVLSIRRWTRVPVYTLRILTLGAIHARSHTSHQPKRGQFTLGWPKVMSVAATIPIRTRRSQEVHVAELHLLDPIDLVSVVRLQRRIHAMPSLTP